jgi:hypothetical protein
MAFTNSGQFYFAKVPVYDRRVDTESTVVIGYANVCVDGGDLVAELMLLPTVDIAPPHRSVDLWPIKSVSLTVAMQRLFDTAKFPEPVPYIVVG